MKLSMMRFPWWTVALLTGLTMAFASGHFVHNARCLFAIPDINPSMLRNRLLACTNIQQSFVLSGMNSYATQEPGWRMLSPRERTGIVLVDLRKYTDKVVFYPRVSDSSSTVAVYERLGKFRKELFRLTGTGEGWTDVGAQYPVCLACVENGWSAEEFSITLEIVLQGRGAQLWHLADTIFFEAP